MAKTKQQKQEIVEKLEQNLEKQKAIYIVDFQNLKASDLFDLRQKLKDAQALFYVAKKRLINLVFKGKKIPIDSEKLEGQTALVFGFEDEITPVKVLNEFQEKNEFPKILGGILDNEFIDQKKAIQLAKLPGKQELYSKLVGTLNSQQSRMVTVLQKNIKGLLMVLNQIKQNG